MNNKVCVDLIVPSVEERYNVFIPVNKKTIEIIFLLNKAINDMTDGNFLISEHLSLINADTGAIYNVDNTFLENKILNGTKLILL
ncbi:MAG TPA: hypothetical protein DCE23_00125 [Firmicutes bacterium]|nr:hypothetical protein [Bacillota bacterium]